MHQNEMSSNQLNLEFKKKVRTKNINFKVEKAFKTSQYRLGTHVQAGLGSSWDRKLEEGLWCDWPY